MNEMDEITYWIYTKRAPCLMSYDNLLKKKESHSLSKRVESAYSFSNETETPSPKKKRKLSLLEDESNSGKGFENVYFETNCNQPQLQQTILSTCTSSDINFKLKKTVPVKNKRKPQKINGSNEFTKRNKVVCSTPKVANLRRSLRNSRKSLNHSSRRNASFELLNMSIINSGTEAKQCKSSGQCKKPPEQHMTHSNTKDVDIHLDSELTGPKGKKDSKVNQKFEDLSDVSGFTANYIRSTKLNSVRNGKKNKTSRSLLKESRASLTKCQSKLVVCVNKSVNTGLPNNNILNHSTDSSQNCLNLVTREINCKQEKVNKSTSLLKFMDATDQTNQATLDTSEQTNKCYLDSSLQSQCNGISRYPKRYSSMRNISAVPPVSTNMSKKPTSKRRKVCETSLKKVPAEKDNSPEAVLKTKTRSAQNSATTLRKSNKSLLVISNTTDVSSAATMNVAIAQTSISSPKSVTTRSANKTRNCSKDITQRKSLNEQSKATRNSIRDKSGFAACFSDSDDDKPLKSQKFFC